MVETKTFWSVISIAITSFLMVKISCGWTNFIGGGGGEGIHVFVHILNCSSGATCIF